MKKFAERLDENGVVVEDDGPRGALVVLDTNHIKKMCHSTSTSGGYCFPTKN